MNYLAHHFVARRAEPETARPAFFVGNILPDLMARDGGGPRLRPKHVTGSVPDATAAAAADLSRGVRLHFATDRRFHAHPEFAAAMAEAAAALRPVLPTSPTGAPPRLFFLAHVAVELALDGVLIRRDRALADHLYAQLSAVDRKGIALAAAQIGGRSSEASSALAATLERFGTARYLYDYETDAGLALALHRICRRASLPGFPAEADRSSLAAVFAQIRRPVEARSEALLSPPERGTWYNETAAR